MQRRYLGGLVVTVALALTSSNASAALTASERSQVRDYVATGKVVNAPKIRALVARTDLSADETAAAMGYALVSSPFDDARKDLLMALVFGDASTASRPVVVQAVVRGLLARADSVLQKAGDGLARDAKAHEELGRIYGFLDAHIANAGKPANNMHDATVGIPPATYDACASALAVHIETHARWLKGGSAVTSLIGQTRAAAQVAYLDMLPDGLTRYVDAADRLGLTGARRRLLAEDHVLLADDGIMTEAQAEKVRDLVVRVGASRFDLEVLRVAHVPAPLRARGLVLHARPAPSTDPRAKSDDDDQVRAPVARALAEVIVSRALDTRPELRAIVDADALAARNASAFVGRPSLPSTGGVLTAAIERLLVHPEAAATRAFTEWLDGKTEPAALVSDAVGVLEAYKPGLVPGVRLSKEGFATAFTAGSHAWAFERTGEGLVVARVTRDKKPFTEALRPRATSASPTADKGTEKGTASAPGVMQPAPEGKTKPASKAAGGH